MSRTTALASTPLPSRRIDRTAAILLLLGGLAFFVGGALHPKDSSTGGTKLEQLHDMLVDPLWYPSHLVFLAAIALITAGLIVIRRRGDLPGRMARLMTVVTAISMLATVAMLIHLFAATEADAIEHGHSTALIDFHTWNETIVNPLWGLAIATLAAAGGLTHTLGNRITLALGLVGGLSFAVATATIAFTDLFDPLFPISSLIGVWAAAVGAIALLRRT
jgi:cytochrome bd-type quinol oxidase subunit 2